MKSLLNIDLPPIILKKKLKTLHKLTEIPKKTKVPLDITTFTKTEEIKIDEVIDEKTASDKGPTTPVTSVEIGSEQIKEAVQKFI